MTPVVAALVVGYLAALVGLFGFFVLCAYLVVKTGGSVVLRDLAVALNAFFRRGSE
jgi:hypothetical protein